MLKPKKFGEVFDRTDTDTATFNQLLKNPEYFKREKCLIGEIKEISPDEYLRTSAERKGISLASDLAIVSKSTVNKYAKQMKQGAKFPMPWFDEHGQQEGRHRALAAKKIGLEKIPVLFVKKIC